MQCGLPQSELRAFMTVNTYSMHIGFEIIGFAKRISKKKMVSFSRKTHRI